MPIHDWTRVHPAYFHDFHLGWCVRLSRALNECHLPSGYYALNETLELRPPSPFREVPEPDAPLVRRAYVADAPVAAPRTALLARDDRRQYACPLVTVRDDLNQPAAAVLCVTGQDRQTQYRRKAIVRSAIGALTRGIHLLIIDLFPPSDRDPQGIHKAIWDELADQPFELPPGKRFTLVSYQVGDGFTAHIEPVGVGSAMPDMPLFLTPHEHVLVPLGATYAATWAVCPEPIRELVEAPAPGTE